MTLVRAIERAMRLATAATILGFALATAACGSTASKSDAVASASAKLATVSSAPPSQSAVAVGTGPALAAPSASAPPTSTEAPTGFAELRARFPEEPPWASGRGTVCDASICGLGDFCCEERGGARCMRIGNEKACTKTGDPVLCDESSDCVAAQRCCSGRTEEGFVTECVSAARCATFWDRPGGYMIPAKEICIRGGACKGKDTVCVAAARASSISGGQCVSSKARVACESKKDCPDDRPWCFWDAKSKKGECIPRGPWLREEGVFECDDHTDCPGGLCCGGNASSFCSAAECDPGLAYAAILCRTAKDCGENPGNVASCGVDDQLPNGLGTCGWSPQERP